MKAITPEQSKKIAVEIFDQALELEYRSSQFTRPWGEHSIRRMRRLMSARLAASNTFEKEWGIEV